MIVLCESEECSPISPPLGNHTLKCGCRFHNPIWCQHCPPRPQPTRNPGRGLVWSSLFPKEA